MPAGGKPAPPVRQVLSARKKNPSQRKEDPQHKPKYNMEARQSAFIRMLADPAASQPALPPISLPARAVALKMPGEVLLSTDANGNCGLILQPTVMSGIMAVTLSTTGVITLGASSDNASAASFTTNFISYVPTALEVQCTYAGAALNTAGRFYGIVGKAGQSTVTGFPIEPNGCEALAEDGISCIWYSTSPVWNNPALASVTTPPTEWMNTDIDVGFMGGPPSLTNCICVRYWLHIAAMPKSGVVGLNPTPSVPDPGAAYMAELFAAATHGIAASAASAKERKRHRKGVKGQIQDVIRFGNKTLGTIMPYVGPAMEAAEILAAMLV